jgi:hypothetical protein
MPYLKFNFNTILSFTHRSPEYSLSYRISGLKFLLKFLISLIRATYPAHLVFLDFITVRMVGMNDVGLLNYMIGANVFLSSDYLTSLF